MSKIYDTIYASNLMYIVVDENDRIQKKDTEMIMFRVIELNGYYFAEEIVTGCIFPICNIYQTGSIKAFKEFSGISIGRYYICDIKFNKGNNFGEIILDEQNQRGSIQYPSIDEINKYLGRRENSRRFSMMMISYQNSNVYLGDISFVKDEINKLKTKPLSDLSEIQNFGYDLSLQDDLCHAIGRERELERIIESAVIKGKSILLIGDSGSGKTAIAEDLARQIKMGINSWLSDKMIISINANSLVAGTKYRGMFEENMNKLVEFARKNKGKVILFIDEVHSLYTLGNSEENRTNDAINILKPYISNRDIVIIGATTSREYREYLVRDQAFCERFDKISIKPLEQNLIIEILLEFIKKISNKYGINYNFSNLRDLILRVLDVTDVKHQIQYNDIRVSTIRLAKDIFEDAFVHAKYQHKTIISEIDVMEALVKCERLSSVVKEQIARSLREESQEENPPASSKIIPFSRALRQH